MENWAVEHERRKEKGYFPKGVESEEGKICWESMCFVLKFEWNYSQNRHQIMRVSDCEELLGVNQTCQNLPLNYLKPLSKHILLS